MVNVLIRSSSIYKFSLVPLMWLIAQSVFAAPKAELIPYWDRFDARSQAEISHQKWQGFLDRNLDQSTADGIYRVRYSKVSAQDLRVLNEYLQKLGALDPRSYTRAQQKAYWINLYNALTVKLILDNYPTPSITKLGESFFRFGPWDDELFKVQGQTLTLNNIEHGILRPIFKDPRIHYAVNCASLGCPNLQSQAFTAENMEALLDEAAREFVNHKRGVVVQSNELVVSSIYHWFEEDFGGNSQQVIHHLIRYAKAPLKSKLEARLKAQDFDYDHQYDWSLNGVE